MPASEPKRGGPRRFVAILLLAAVVAPPVTMGWLAFNLGRAFRDDPRPRAIFVLGGRLERVHHAMRMAAVRPGMPIVISSGISGPAARRLADEAGIDPARVTVDPHAVDTLTNFTKMVAGLEARDQRHVYLVTSDYHMRRACFLAGIIFAARGIAFTPVPVASRQDPETIGHALRDALRALVWLVSGWDGQRIPFGTILRFETD